MLPTCPALVAFYLFWLGAALGMTALVMTAYIGVSPRWLRWLLLLCAIAIGSRYLTMLAFAINPDPLALRGWARCWFAPMIGLTFPAVVAVDALVRHPAMTPKKLLQWYAPFFAVYLLILCFGPIALVRDPIVGMHPQLIGWARGLLILAQTIFTAALLWVCAMLWLKLRAASTRLALAGLMLAYGYLAVDGLLVSLGRWYVRPFLFSEIAALFALWLAFDIARKSPT